MKKSILKLYSLVLIVLIVASCADLDLPSDGRLTMNEIFEEYYRTKNYYSQCYSYIPYAGFTYGSTPLASFSDEAHDASDGVVGAVNIWYSNRTSAINNPLEIYWETLFEGILKCNTFLQCINDPEIATATIDPLEKEGWVGEIRVLRAFYYLQLIKRYGGVPIIDTPYELDHDFSQDRRATFEECVDFIIADCDFALAIPESGKPMVGFRWNINNNERTVFSRAVAYAIKSQASLYAASPLWNAGSKYTWEKATEITKEALDQCLAHGFKLFDITPAGSIAQNAYEYYFINRSDASRSIDKETIYESALRSEVWSLAGTPMITGAIKAGAGPSQELVDAYGMQETGEMPVLGYSDAAHLQPRYNPDATDYDPLNPYIGRDPRFYASIYFNESPRELYSNDSTIEATFPLTYSAIFPSHAVEVTDINTTEFHIKTTGGDPYVYTSGVNPAGDEDGYGINPDKIQGVPTLKFEYKSDQTSNHFQILYFYDVGTHIGQNDGVVLPQASDWTEYKFTLEEAWYDLGWGLYPEDFLRLDPEDDAGYEITIRNLRIEMIAPPGPPPADLPIVETFVGGNCEISSNITETRYTRTGYYMRKFNNHRSNAQLVVDGFMRVFRLGELYLNFAEAAYNAYGPDIQVGGMSAREAVNTVRARVAMPALPTGLSKEQFEVRYRNERQVELAFEEHRFFDVRRWKILNQTDGFVTGMRITKVGEDYLYDRFKLQDRGTNSDKYLMYPVPLDEAAKMENFTGVSWQNPGWN